MREARRGNPVGVLLRCASRNDRPFIKGRWYEAAAGRLFAAGRVPPLTEAWNERAQVGVPEGKPRSELPEK